MSASIVYNDVGQLVASWDFTGRIGRTIVSLTLSNGATLTGMLDKPVEPPMVVHGTGTWSNS